MGRQIRGLRRTFFGLAGLLVALYFWSFALQRGARAGFFPVFIAVLLASTIVVAVVVHLLYFLHAKIVYDGRLRKYNLFGSRDYALAQIGRVQRLAVTSMGPPGRIAAVLTPEGRSLFIVWLAYWSESDFEEFWRSIGITLAGSYDDLLPYDSLLTTYPPADSKEAG